MWTLLVHLPVKDVSSPIRASNMEKVTRYRYSYGGAVPAAPSLSFFSHATVKGLAVLQLQTLHLLNIRLEELEEFYMITGQS